MKPSILLLNWRDPWHPRAGGAEFLTLRILERLVERGYPVEWFSSRYAGCAEDESKGGIRYVRRGSEATVHLAAYRRYGKRTDLGYVVDEINTIPFYAMAYRSGKKIAYINQLAREIWLYEGGMLAPFGYIAEPLYLIPYRNSPIITISESSKQTLRGIGLHGEIAVIPMNVDEPPIQTLTPKVSQDIVIVARLARSKRIEHAIEAAAIMRQHQWSGALNIVGGTKDQRYERQLRKLCERRLGSQGKVWGRVTTQQRRALQQSASILWMTSAREGWGLVVTEAARLGTPSVVYDVPGLRDAVKDGRTGYVVAPSPRALADASLRMLSEGVAAFAERARDDSARLSWDGTADAFEGALLAL
ncbi:MAG TPA: glycosyltransferase family 4 protein [Verrucomicrobiae bacterium]|nr:glycosyltransferase family 4 protein [Verrucomicrobiae bacterium]